VVAWVPPAGTKAKAPASIVWPAIHALPLQHVDMLGRVVVGVPRLLGTRLESDDADDHPSGAPKHLMLHARQPAQRLPGLVVDGFLVAHFHRVGGRRNPGLAHRATLRGLKSDQ